MAQTTILGRVGQLLRANINSLLDGAEDPEKMLDQLVRDFTNNMSEAEDAVAPADIDPAYAAALEAARAAGVEIAVHRCAVAPDGIVLAGPLPWTD